MKGLEIEVTDDVDTPRMYEESFYQSAESCLKDQKDEKKTNMIESDDLKNNVPDIEMQKTSRKNEGSNQFLKIRDFREMCQNIQRCHFPYNKKAEQVTNLEYREIFSIACD